MTLNCSVAPKPAAMTPDSTTLISHRAPTTARCMHLVDVQPRPLGLSVRPGRPGGLCLVSVPFGPASGRRRSGDVCLLQAVEVRTAMASELTDRSRTQQALIPLVEATKPTRARAHMYLLCIHTMMQQDRLHQLCIDIEQV